MLATDPARVVSYGHTANEGASTVPLKSPPDDDPSPAGLNRVQRRHGIEKAAYSMNEAAAKVGLSRSYLYQEAAAGRLATKKVGRRRLVLGCDLATWLDALPSA